MAPSSSASAVVSPISQTPTPFSSEKKQFLWQRPKLMRNGHSLSTSGSSTQRVKFSSPSSSKGSASDRDKKERGDGYSSASHSEGSRPPSPIHNNTPAEISTPKPGDGKKRPWQKINRQAQATLPTSAPPSPPPVDPDEPRPFLVYSDAFLSIIGPTPSLSTIITDTRAPFFHNSGIFCPRTSTLYLTSAPYGDPSPSAAPSRNQTATVTKIDFHGAGEFTRDKVRTPEHTYMPQSGCAYKSGLVLCAQGTLQEPAALLYMDGKRPHRTYPLLTNFGGERLNSPHSCATHLDGSLWFSDPHLNARPGFRPRPKLPALVYRFALETADLRPVISDLPNPTSLAFGPECRTLYVLDLPVPSAEVMPASGGGGGGGGGSGGGGGMMTNGHGNGMMNGHHHHHRATGSNGNNNNLNINMNGGNHSPTKYTFPPPPSSSSTTPSNPLALAQIFAYTVHPVGPTSSPFLTSKRLFAIPMHNPLCLAVDLFGNVYVGCSHGVQVYDMGGTMVGRIATEGPVTGLSFGRGGELWVSLGDRLARVQLAREIRTAYSG